ASYAPADRDGSAVNDQLGVVAVGPQATGNEQPGGHLVLLPDAERADALGAQQSLPLNLRQIRPANACLVARRATTGVGGDIVLAADSIVSVVGVASLLAGGNLAVAGRSGALPGAVISAGQRLALRVGRDDQGAKGQAVSVMIGGRLLAPEIQIHGSA